MRHPVPEGGYFNRIYYGNNTFIVVGGSGHIMTSDNGSDWVSQDSGDSSDLFDVVYANGLFVAVGSGSTIQPGQRVRWAMNCMGSHMGTTALWRSAPQA